MLLVLALVAAWSVLIPGFMDWDDIVAAVIGSLRLTGPLGAAFAAWVAFRRRRAERGRVLTPWRAARAPLSIIAVVTGSFGATVLLLGLRAALTGQGGAMLPGGLAMSVAGLGLYVVVGWILGWLVPVVVVPLIAGAGTYALFTWLATGPHWADRLTPAAGEPYDLIGGVSETAYTDQTLWLLGLSTALLLGWVALVTRRTLALAAAVIAVLAAGTGAARLVTVPRTVPVSERLVCQEWPISVCVHPALRGGLAELATVFTALAMRLDGTPAAFRRVEQRAFGDKDPAGPEVVVVHLDDLGSGYAQRAATEFLDRLARPCPGTVAAGYRSIVVAWLRGASLPSGPLREHHQASIWFSELSEAQRHDWLHMFYSDFVSCGLQAKHFGGGSRPAEPVATTYPVNPTPAYTPNYPIEPTKPGAAVATGVPVSPEPGWGQGADPRPGGSGATWTGQNPSASPWPSPPGASPAGQNPAGQGSGGQGPAGRNGPGAWGMPGREGARRHDPWVRGRRHAPHPWRPRTGRPGDTASSDRPGAPGASPSPTPTGPASQGGAQKGAQGGAQGGSQRRDNAQDRGRRPGQGVSGRAGGSRGNGQGADDARSGRRARPERVPGQSGGRTDHGRPATGDVTDADETDPQDDAPEDTGVAGVPGALLAPAQ